MKRLLGLSLALSMSILLSCGNRNKLTLMPETEKVVEAIIETDKEETTTAKIDETETNLVADEKQSSVTIDLINSNGDSSMKPVVYFTKDITAN